MKFLIELLTTDICVDKFDDIYMCHCCNGVVKLPEIKQHFTSKKCYYEHPDFLKLFFLQTTKE
jgi:hypothetical protein